SRFGGLECPTLFGIEDRHIGEAAARQRSASRKVEDAAWSGGKQFNDTRKRYFVLTMKRGDRQCQCCLQAGDAERSFLEFNLRFVSSMWGVVGGNCVHGAIGERYDNGLEIGCGAQWRVHLEVGAILANVLVNQREVVRRDLAGDACFGSFAAADGLERI